MADRSFKITNVTNSNGEKLGFEGGRFISRTPASAAGKAGSQICKETGTNSLVITIQETTSGSTKKEKRYTYNRVKDPTLVNHNGVDILHEWKTIVRAY